MRRPEGFLYVRVRFRTRIFVAHENGNRGAESLAFEEAGENFATVLLIALRDNLALPRTATVEIALDIRFANLDAGWAPVDDDTDAATV
jgi:hypothetical protein